MLLHLAAHWRYIWLVVASFCAGVLNAMAGGGSFLSFPAMLGVGVAPIQANATNTVALWPGQLTSVVALRSDLRRDLLPTVLLVALVGGTAGAWVLLHTGQAAFLHLIPWLLLTARSSSGPPRPSRAGSALADPRPRVLHQSRSPPSSSSSPSCPSAFTSATSAPAVASSS